MRESSFFFFFLQGDPLSKRVLFYEEYSFMRGSSFMRGPLS